MDKEAERGRLEIYALILEAASNGATKSKIREEVMIPYDRLNERLGELERFNLLEQNNKTYTTTGKGSTYLTNYELLMGFLYNPEEEKRNNL